MPDPAYPQAMNRYSYCLNNPLKYNDPTGYNSHEGGYYDQGDWYYESLWEANYDTEPESGYMFSLDAGGTAHERIDLATFAGWADSTLDPYDYYSIETINIANNVLNGMYYHKDLGSDPMLIEYVTKGISPSGNNNIQWDKIISGLIIMYGASQIADLAMCGMVLCAFFLP